MAQASRPALTAEQKRDMWSRWKAGQSLSEIGRALGRERSAIHRMVATTGGYVPVDRRRSPRVLSLPEREEISRGLAEGISLRMIAARAGRAPSTISREIARHGERHRYRAIAADERAWQRSRRPKRASSPARRRCGSSWRASSRSTGHRSRSRAGLSTRIRRSRLCRCRPRRSTAASSCKPAGCCARSCWPTCAPAAASVARASPLPRARAAAASSTRSPSASARLRPRTGRCDSGHAKLPVGGHGLPR